ncbi:hypothetical protein ACF1BP_35495 [Streptomyces sp. NPDC014735]|uniref:hypothetical protein n=1 Tax=unclassified Streptomyces TaxID=2593676 RepID=UPI0036FB383A
MFPPAPSFSEPCIPDIAPRRHAIALLCAAYYKPDSDTVFHHDETPFTPEEQAAVRSATHDEIEEAARQQDRYVEYVHAWLDAPDALDDFLAPFLDRLPEASVGNAVDIMNKDERAEFQRLLDAVTEPFRPFAPNTF